jgi:hypothetical protein
MNIEQGISNFEVAKKLSHGFLSLDIRNSLFDIRYYFLSANKSYYKK